MNRIEIKSKEKFVIIPLQEYENMKKIIEDVTLSEEELSEVRNAKEKISKHDFKDFISIDEFSDMVNEGTKKYKRKK